MTSHVHGKISRPSKFLADNVGLLPVGRALDIAMGSGRNAVFLSQAGFSVEGIDISRENVETALKYSQKVGVTINAHVANLEGNYHIKKGAYDVIICFNYLQRSLIPAIKQGLSPGGMVVFETFLIDQSQLFGKPKNPDYLLEHNELLKMFSDFRCLRYREGIIEHSKAIASIIAQKEPVNYQRQEETNGNFSG